MTYEWSENGVKSVTAWSKAVRDAMLKGGAEFQRQKVCVFVTAGPSTKLFVCGGGGILEDMRYERRRAEACVY
jgi:hypothetical protein